METDAAHDHNQSSLIMTSGIEAGVCVQVTSLAIDQEACREDQEKVSEGEQMRFHKLSTQTITMDLWTTLAIGFQVFTWGFLICLTIHLLLISIIYISYGYSADAIRSIRFTGKEDRPWIIKGTAIIFILHFFPASLYYLKDLSAIADYLFGSDRRKHSGAAADDPHPQRYVNQNLSNTRKMYKASVIALASLIAICLVMDLNLGADDLMIDIVLTWDELTIMMMNHVWICIFCFCILFEIFWFSLECRRTKIDWVMDPEEKTQKLEHRIQVTISSVRFSIACIFLFNLNHFIMNLIIMSPDATPGAVLIRELDANLAPHVMCLLFLMPYLSHATHHYEFTRLVLQTLSDITDRGPPELLPCSCIRFHV